MVGKLFIEHNLDMLKDVSKYPNHISFSNSPEQWLDKYSTKYINIYKYSIKYSV